MLKKHIPHFQEDPLYPQLYEDETLEDLQLNGLLLIQKKKGFRFGMDAVLLTSDSCDPLNRRAVRVSMGSVFLVPWTWLDLPQPSLLRGKGQGGKGQEDCSGSWYSLAPCPSPLAPLGELERLHDMGFTTAAMALRKDNVSIDDPKLKAVDRLALIMGTEGDGLPETVIDAADYVVKIPMHHGVDSLNVGNAAAIAFWELA